MPSYGAAIEIGAPPEAVYAYVADLGRHGEWSADPLTVEPAGEGHFRSTAVSKGKTITADLVVTEQAPPERFAFEAVDLTGHWVNRFTIVPAARGSLLRREISGDLSGMQLILFWLVLLPVKKPNARRALERLKERLER